MRHTLDLLLLLAGSTLSSSHWRRILHQRGTSIERAVLGTSLCTCLSLLFDDNCERLLDHLHLIYIYWNINQLKSFITTIFVLEMNVFRGSWLTNMSRRPCVTRTHGGLPYWGLDNCA